MTTFEMKTLLFVTAVALFPIACGTTSPTGPDAAGDGSVSALRLGEPLPPTAPEPQSPETVPVPSPKPDPGPDVPPVARDGSDPMPVPAEPSDPGTPQADKCLAASIEITELNVLVEGTGLSLEAQLFDAKHTAITNSSCSKLEWRVEATQSDANRASSVTIDSSADGRNVTLSGPAGIYKVGVTAPSNAHASRLVTIPAIQPPPPPVTQVVAPVPPAAPAACQAVSLDISSVSPVVRGTAVWSFQASLKDAQGREITNPSCETIVWEIDGAAAGLPPVISYGATSRLITITGLMSGSTYKLGATSPNGKSGALVILVP